ncbi:DUF262 domain-containing protein [Mycena kentingensis (nom. inval.)]|nr:DUF262 domain-containing protein [Mycena kentingensis (nom. inval.)]
MFVRVVSVGVVVPGRYPSLDSGRFLEQVEELSERVQDYAAAKTCRGSPKEWTQLPRQPAERRVEREADAERNGRRNDPREVGLGLEFVTGSVGTHEPAGGRPDGARGAGRAREQLAAKTSGGHRSRLNGPADRLHPTLLRSTTMNLRSAAGDAGDDDDDYSSDDDQSHHQLRSPHKSGSCLRHKYARPSRVSYTTVQLFEWLREGKIDLGADYQRDVVWQQIAQQGLIDSVLRDAPVSVLMFAKYTRNGAEIWRCVDGKQRLTSLYKFMNGEIPFRNSEDKLSYWWTGSKRLLPKVDRDDFMQATVPCVVYDVGGLTQQDERDIFQRIQRGRPLTSGEKLRAIDSPRANLVHELENLFVENDAGSLRDFNPLRNNFFTKYATRAVPFRTLAQLVGALDKGFPKAMVSSNALHAWLEDPAPVSAQLLRRVQATIDVLAAIHTSPDSPLQGMAPVEVLACGAFVERRLSSSTLETLVSGIRAMRADVRRTYAKDMKVNTRVLEHMEQFSRSFNMRLKPGDVSAMQTVKRAKLGPQEGDSRKRKRAPTPSGDTPQAKRICTTSVATEGDDDIVILAHIKPIQPPSFPKADVNLPSANASKPSAHIPAHFRVAGSMSPTLAGNAITSISNPLGKKSRYSALGVGHVVGRLRPDDPPADAVLRTESRSVSTPSRLASDDSQSSRPRSATYLIERENLSQTFLGRSSGSWEIQCDQFATFDRATRAYIADQIKPETTYNLFVALPLDERDPQFLAFSPQVQASIFGRMYPSPAFSRFVRLEAGHQRTLFPLLSPAFKTFICRKATYDHLRWLVENGIVPINTLSAICQELPDDEKQTLHHVLNEAIFQTGYASREGASSVPLVSTPLTSSDHAASTAAPSSVDTSSEAEMERDHMLAESPPTGAASPPLEREIESLVVGDGVGPVQPAHEDLSAAVKQEEAEEKPMTFVPTGLLSVPVKREDKTIKLEEEEVKRMVKQEEDEEESQVRRLVMFPETTPQPSPRKNMVKGKKGMGPPGQRRVTIG